MKQEGGMGLRKAFRLYNVLCESLRRVNGTVDLDCRTGPSTVLTEEEEDALIHYCFQMADMSFGLTKEDVMHTVCTVGNHSGRVHPFTDGTTGQAWFDGFRARHPCLTLHSTQGLSYSQLLVQMKQLFKISLGSWEQFMHDLTSWLKLHKSSMLMKLGCQSYTNLER